MTTEIWLALVGILSASISSLITWLINRKKNEEEVESMHISNLTASLDFYKKLSDDTTDRLEELLKRNETLENEVISLKQQIVELKELLHTESQGIDNIKKTLNKKKSNEKESR